MNRTIGPTAAAAAASRASQRDHASRFAACQSAGSRMTTATMRPEKSTSVTSR
jgi:hypothetical protein